MMGLIDDHEIESVLAEPVKLRCLHRDCTDPTTSLPL